MRTPVNIGWIQLNYRLLSKITTKKFFWGSPNWQKSPRLFRNEEKLELELARELEREVIQSDMW